MLKAQAILDTLTEGCAQGSFVLRLTRPDGSFRTRWHSRADETAMSDPALELVLPTAAELAELPYQLLSPHTLPELWMGDDVTVQSVLGYFNGKTVVQVARDGYTEPVSIPKVGGAVVNKVITAAVEAGALWLTNGPASIVAEPIPAGVLTPKAILRQPPAMIAAAEILPENLPDAWSEGQATALSIATALSQMSGHTMPWKTVKDVITAVDQCPLGGTGRHVGSVAPRLPGGSVGQVEGVVTARPGVGAIGAAAPAKCLIAHAELEPSEIQDLGEISPDLLELKARFGTPSKFRVQIELGDGVDAAG